MTETPSARRMQRLGAYAVVVRDDDRGTPHLLLTRISSVGYPVGSWALPGGGVDHGEHPDASVVRELHEETGLTARSARLVDVHAVHVVELGREDRYEDYHGVHLLYAVDVEDAGERLPVPEVVEVGGTTDLAAWVPLEQLESGGRDLLPAVLHILEDVQRYR